MTRRTRTALRIALGAWHQDADGDSAEAEPALVPRLLAGRACRGPLVPHPVVIDDFSRECLVTVVDTSISGIRVVRKLDRIAGIRGYPCMLVSDDGTELTSDAMLKWQQERGVG